MKTRNSIIVLSFALVLALLASSLPTEISIAQKSQPNCPPVELMHNTDLGFRKSLPKECLKQETSATSPQIGNVSSLALQSNGGPDDFGYTFDDTVPYGWISASNLLQLSGDDADSGAIQIASGIFLFPFYGSNHSTLYVSTNGLLTFDTGSCCDWGGPNIPDPTGPNNFIAPFWDDLVVGSPDNAGAIYWDTGGTAPDRYYVIEWRDVTTYYDSTPFSFEAILYENGNILIQHQSLPTSYYSTIGIENATGDDGLEYQVGDSGLSAPKAIKFYYPTAPTPRLQVTPLTSGKFATLNNDTYFPLTITNNGSAGTDTYDLSATSSWPVNFYQDGCVTPLTDTDTDSALDTGPLPEGSTTTICVGFTPPTGLEVGSSNSASILIASSLDPSKAKNAEMDMVIPTSFAQTFEDYTNAAPAFRISQPEGILTIYPTSDFYYAATLATIRLPDGRYLNAWRKPDGNYPDSFSDIEFTFINNDGTTSTPVVKLTSNTGTGQTYDYAPSLTIAPDGTIGVAWYRWLVDNNTGLNNYNIYFATMSSSGTLLSGPINVTNNNLWDDFNDLNVPHFFNVTVASTSNNNFVVSWEDYRTDGTFTYDTNIWYTVLDSSGANVFAPVPLSSLQASYDPILNTLDNGNAILTFAAYDGNAYNPYYAVITGDGTMAYPPTSLDLGSNYFPTTSPDAISLSNGSIAIAWPTYYGIALSTLDSAYNISTGPTFADTSNVTVNQTMSVTRDADDKVIMTWTDSDSYPASKLFYALADSTGAFITNPIPMQTSTSGLSTSENGQGNAPYIISTNIEISIDIRPDSETNPINTKSMGTIPVAILSTSGFDAPSMVDITSLTFGKTGDETSLAFCNDDGADINSDGMLDLVCHFTTQETGLQQGDTNAILRGKTLDGTNMEGNDAIKVLK